MEGVRSQARRLAPEPLRTLLAPSVLRAVRPEVKRTCRPTAEGFWVVSEAYGEALFERLREETDLVLPDNWVRNFLVSHRTFLVRTILGRPRDYVELLRYCGLRPGWWRRPAWSRKSHGRRRNSAKRGPIRAGVGLAALE